MLFSSCKMFIIHYIPIALLENIWIKGQRAISMFNLFLNEWVSKLGNIMKKGIYYNNFYTIIFLKHSFTKWRGRRRGRNWRSIRLEGNSSIIWLLIWLLKNHGVLKDRGRENPYRRANCKPWKGQCSDMRCTNISPRGKGSRIPPRGNPWLVDSIFSP